MIDLSAIRVLLKESAEGIDDPDDWPDLQISHIDLTALCDEVDHLRAMSKCKYPAEFLP